MVRFAFSANYKLILVSMNLLFRIISPLQVLNTVIVFYAVNMVDSPLVLRIRHIPNSNKSVTFGINVIILPAKKFKSQVAFNIGRG